jgi:phosphohistidine phosphatase
MSKTLYLVRHAKSSWKHSGLSDSERPLNKRGKHDAPMMGKVLREKNEIPELIISSPAKRTLSTAKHYAKELGYEMKKIKTDNSLYFGDVNDYLVLLEGIDDKFNNVMLFTHNPGITYFVNYISGSNIENIPTAGTAKIDLNITSWREIINTQGKLNFFIFPKMILK